MSKIVRKATLGIFCGILLAASLLSLVLIAKADTSSSTPAVTTAADSSDEVADLNKQLDEQRAKIDDLTKKIADYNIVASTAGKQAVTLKNQILILDNQIAATRMEQSLKEEQAKSIQIEIDKTNIQIKETEKNIADEKDRLAEVIRLIAKYEDRDYLTIMLSNDNFSDFFDQLKYSTDLQKEAQRSLNRIQETEAKLLAQNEQLTAKKDELLSILNKLDETKMTLSSQKDDKNQLMVITKQSEKKFQGMITDLRKEQAAANAQVAALEKKIRAQLAKKGSAEKFNTLSNAILAWPTASHRVTCTFHDPSYPYRNLFEHSGLDIGVGLGTKVMAADAGYIAKVEYNTKWYGSYIMIIHGGNISTLYGHLSQINVKQDDYVAKGQQIGLSGNTGFSSGPHLHLEVRSNGVPVNPLSYLP